MSNTTSLSQLVQYVNALEKEGKITSQAGNCLISTVAASCIEQQLQQTLNPALEKLDRRINRTFSAERLEALFS